MKSAARLGESAARTGGAAEVDMLATVGPATDNGPQPGVGSREPERPYHRAMASERGPGIPLGRVLGVPIYLAPSWFVVAAVVIVAFEPAVASSSDVGRPATFVVAGGFVVLLLLSVLVHELAHASAALSLGMPVKEIVATLWGGHTQFEDEAPTPGRSALVAVVGPLSNGVLAGVGLLLLTRLDGGVTRLLLLALVATNGFVAVFNLAPGLPLDGGRLVESGVWALTGRRWRGTVVAGWCGRVVAVLVLVWTLGLPLLDGRTPGLFSLVWSVLIAGMLWQGASSAIAVGKVHRGAEALDLATFTAPAVASPAATSQWQSGDLDDTLHVVAIDAGGRPVGVLTPQARQQLSASGQPPPGTPLASVMTVLDPSVTLPATSSGADVLAALATRPAYTYVVVDARGDVVGLAQGQRLADAVTGRT